ncbi:MAG: DoxX family protein [Acidimicrobiia bacterium]|nr:DoxX family protein [Acidimicrobiia bacterium]MBA3956507.1 DoxX family protein [Acidimicrobiia bacterium]
MAITRKIARPMLAAMFVTGGLDAVKRPDGKTAKAETVTEPLAEPLGLPDDTAKLVKINGAVQIGAGLMLATGRLPRLAAATLAVSLVPTTLAGHRFWEADADARAGQQIHFFKNVSMLGGLILAATDTEGRPSLAWRARKAAERAQRSLPGDD